MIKAISKYILSLIVLLLGLSNQLSAFSNKTSTYIAPTQSFKNVNVAKDIHVRNLTTIFSSNVADSRGSIFYDYSEEQEEDDDEKCIVTHKKHYPNAYISSTPFYHSFTKLFLFNTSQVLHFGKHFSQYPLNKLFVVFRVFRI